MANKHTDPAWADLLETDLLNDGATVGSQIETARVSDGDTDNDWVLIGTLSDGRYISCRATPDGIHAMSISTNRGAVLSDMQRFRVAERLGEPKGDPKPYPGRGR